MKEACLRALTHIDFVIYWNKVEVEMKEACLRALTPLIAPFDSSI